MKNETHQKNEAFVFSPTLAVGNNLALISKGDQTTVAGTSVEPGQCQLDRSEGRPEGVAGSAGWIRSESSATTRRVNGNRKDDSRCHEQPAPVSYEKQTFRGKDECRPKDEQHSAPGQHLDQEQTVKNETHQKNEAFVFSPTVAVAEQPGVDQQG